MSIWHYKKRYYVRVTYKGKLYRGEKGYANEIDAKIAEGQLLSELKKNHSIVISQDEPFLTLWNQYLDHCQQFNSKKWYDAKRYIGGKYFKKWFPLPLSSITPMVVEAHLIERRKKSARSANLDFEILRAFFTWLIQMEFIDKSPVRSLRKFSQNKKPKIIPTKTEVDQLIKANEGQEKLLILLLVNTMARIGEIKELRWDDIDLVSKVLFLKTKKTRDGSETLREIPINGLLLDALTSLEPKEGYVLKSRYAGQAYRDLRKKLQKCLRQAGVSSISGFHQLRHYGASQLANAGVDFKTIQELLGHTSLNTTNIYLQALSETKRKAVELLS